MATVEECEQAFRALAQRLADADPATRKKSSLDRSLTCRLPDIDTVFGGRLRDGQLIDIHRVDQSDGQVKLTMSSDDLILMTRGELNFASAWANGRIKIDASMLDMVRLRSVF